MKWMLPLTCLLASVTSLSHASTVRADKLPAPTTMTCLQMKQDISYTLKRGLLHIPVEYKLERGAYISEHEDANGVYYRAPAGAITTRRADASDSSVAGRRLTFEGGIYVPNDPAVAPTIYEYYGTSAGGTRFAPDKTDCSTVTYTVDPVTHKVNVWAVGAATGIGAATGMAVHTPVHASYGQSAGVGLVGGLIGGLIIGAIENSKIGGIVAGPPLDDGAVDKIKALAGEKVTMAARGHAGGAVAPVAAPSGPATQIAAVSSDANEAGQAPAGPAPDAPIANQTPAVSTVAAVTTASSPLDSQAQSVANQLGCGAVKANATGGYIAPCGSHGVYIDCDAGHCRPTHTVKPEEYE